MNTSISAALQTALNAATLLTVNMQTCAKLLRHQCTDEHVVDTVLVDNIIAHKKMAKQLALIRYLQNI